MSTGTTVTSTRIVPGTCCCALPADDGTKNKMNVVVIKLLMKVFLVSMMNGSIGNFNELLEP